MAPQHLGAHVWEVWDCGGERAALLTGRHFYKVPLRSCSQRGHIHKFMYTALSSPQAYVHIDPCIWLMCAHKNMCARGRLREGPSRDTDQRVCTAWKEMQLVDTHAGLHTHATSHNLTLVHADMHTDHSPSSG